MTILKLTLPVPPSANTYYRNFRGRMVMSAKGREFNKSVAEYIAENRFRKFWDARVSVLILLHPKDKRKLDIDNRIKPVLDALQSAGVFNNDEQVDQASILRCNIIRGGKAIVYVEEIKAEYGNPKEIGDFRPIRYQSGDELTRSSRCDGCQQANGAGHRDQSTQEIETCISETQNT